ncbi:MAG: hypothetical protein ACTHLT_14450, partial [Devosia sp.]
MPDVSTSQSKPQAAPARRAREPVGRPFYGLIDAVLVPDPAAFDFDGAVAESHAQALWTWMSRDLAPDLMRLDLGPDDPAARAALDLVIPEIIGRAREAARAVYSDAEAERRLIMQMGGEGPYNRLPVLLNALKCRNLLEKAQSFGRATNAMTDEAALGQALQSMPLNDPVVSALLLQSAVGPVSHPGRLMAAVIRMAGGATEQAIVRAGFGPLVDAIFSQAQAQVPALQQFGAFADIDMVCRAIDRFHRLMRSVMGFVELNRLSRWSSVAAGLTTTVSELVEPKLRDVGPSINLALRRPSGTDRVDSEQLLAALNGCYVLATVRDCRDSLALNALFDQTWQQVGQALEIHVQRNLELFRSKPSD